jgi:hypothetical protein
VRARGEVPYVRCVGAVDSGNDPSKRIGVGMDVTDHEVLTQRGFTAVPGGAIDGLGPGICMNLAGSHGRLAESMKERDVVASLPPATVLTNVAATRTCDIS